VPRRVCERDLSAPQVNALLAVKRVTDVTSRQLQAGAPSSGAWSLYGPRQRWGLLAILFLVTTSNYFDYYVVSIILEPIKQEFEVSDTMLGLLSGFSFAALYAVAALPIAHWADRGNRRTVITLTLLGWSVMTAVCGLAQSFLQLVLARLGVAVTEPGAAPPSQSLIADYFPPERRATAIAILSQGGSAAGYCVGVGLGGYIAARHGWRSAFLVAGIPGLFLAVLVRWLLAEPRCQLGFPAAGPKAESTAQSLVQLQAKRSFLLALSGTALYAFFAYGVSVFLPSFMIRILHATLEQVSITWGFIVAVAMIIGALIGGWLADRLSRRDIRWYAWLPAIAYAVGTPLYWLTLSTDHLWTFIAVDFPAEVILAIGYSVSFAPIHVICGNQRRAVAIAIIYFSSMLIGCGFGPLIAGALSDALSSFYGSQSLRYSLLSMVLLLIPAAAAFYGAARTMLKDLEE
jgi:predicted MFS family arabinose efflux permease